MTFAAVDICPLIRTRIETDPTTLVGGGRAAEIRAQPQFVYRREWQPGDMIIWDNIGAVHRVEPCPSDSGRLMHRVTLEGEEEIA